MDKLFNTLGIALERQQNELTENISKLSDKEKALINPFLEKIKEGKANEINIEELYKILR